MVGVSRRIPPSTATTEPCRAAPAREQTWPMVAATSAGSRTRPRPLAASCAVSSRPYSAAVASSIAVRVAPGATATATTPVPVRSAARPRTRPTTACLTIVYAPRWKSPREPATDATPTNRQPDGSGPASIHGTETAAVRHIPIASTCHRCRHVLARRLPERLPAGDHGRGRHHHVEPLEGLGRRPQAGLVAHVADDRADAVVVGRDRLQVRAGGEGVAEVCRPRPRRSRRRRPAARASAARAPWRPRSPGRRR